MGSPMKEFVLEPSVELIESMRAVGYSTEAAVADIIDNSIDAAASLIEIDLDVVNARHIAVFDNGWGMTPDEAKEALRFAGTAGASGKARLGRVGLGLKTASLSQARTLTVVSKKDCQMHALVWDLDHVKRTRTWAVLEPEIDEIEIFPFKDELESLEAGTVVIWTGLDLLLGDSDNPGTFLRRKVADLSEHLSVTFHRYLSSRTNRLDIVLNGQKLKAFDPFLTSNVKTQQSPVEEMLVGGEKVSFTSYTLPHASALTLEERARPDLGERMKDFQGFYLYRNKRLISRGKWFGLAPVKEISKQTRIMVDVPQGLDGLWQVDIKKSQAEPPSSFKSRLQQMIPHLLEKGRKIHTFRGRTAKSETVHIWNKVTERDGFRYEINTSNPLIGAFLQTLESRQSEQLVSIFNSIAGSFPVLDAYQEQAANRQSVEAAFDPGEMESKLRLLKSTGLLGADIEKTIISLANVEPFDEVPNLEDVVRKIWSET